MNLSSLNPQQRLAVQTIQGPLLILAGAGTGKTRVITHRIVHLIENGIAPGSVLAVTFTNKAAREMKERVIKLVSQRQRENESRPTLCTFHSLCVRILRKHIDRLGYKKNFVIFSESEQLGVVKKILSHISTAGEKADAGEVLQLLGKLRNSSDAGESIGPNGMALAVHIRKKYESALKACNAVDFDGLILLTLRLFSEHPDALEACRHQYRYVMVDEYQDTNHSQFQLVQALTTVHRNLCVVGDDDQSIYGWRGAEVANLLNLEIHYPEVKVIKLEQNYRSTGIILKAANALIKNNPRRRGKQLWSSLGDGEKITLFTFSDDEQEARSSVEQIEANRLLRGIPWSQQAILFRTNIQSRVLETALRKASVAYHLIGGQSYFDRREVRDFLAYLKTFLNPDDDISLLRIANVPARGLSDVTMERLLAASQERGCSVYAAMRAPEVQAGFMKKTAEAVKNFVELLDQQRRELEGQANFSLKKWANAFLDCTGYLEELRRSDKSVEGGESRVRNLRDLVDSLEDYDSVSGTGMGKLERFLEEITLDSEREEEKEQKGDAVTLITIHSCKGLEFPHVFIVGLEEGLLPHTRSASEGTIDEERRLFYVAITRAMKTLTLGYCVARKRYGQAVPSHPSRFLSELPPELLEDGDAKGKQPIALSSGKGLFESMRSSLS